MDVELLSMCAELEGLPIEFTHVGNGQDALAKVLDNPGAIDLVLMDLNLPLMSGFEVIEQVRTLESLRSLPVVALSGSSAHSDITRAIDAGATAYIVKPPSAPEIRDLLRGIYSFWSRHRRA